MTDSTSPPDAVWDENDPATWAFLNARRDFDRLFEALAKLRAAEFNAKPAAVNWGDSGSVGYINGLLTHALDHYGARA